MVTNCTHIVSVISMTAAGISGYCSACGQFVNSPDWSKPFVASVPVSVVHCRGTITYDELKRLYPAVEEHLHPGILTFEISDGYAFIEQDGHVYIVEKDSLTLML